MYNFNLVNFQDLKSYIFWIKLGMRDLRDKSTYIYEIYNKKFTRKNVGLLSVIYLKGKCCKFTTLNLVVSQIFPSNFNFVNARL